MRIVLIIILAFAGATVTAPCLAATTSDLELEKMIAYGQGRFGAYYAVCGNQKQKVLIGGSLANWRKETFEGYTGSQQDLHTIQDFFDHAAMAVKNDKTACENWTDKAQTAWLVLQDLAATGRDQHKS